MNKTKLITGLLLACSCLACQNLTLPNGAKVRTFGQKTSFAELSYGTNGVLYIKGYNNDQVTALQMAFQAGMQAAKMAVVP